MSEASAISSVKTPDIVLSSQDAPVVPKGEALGKHDFFKLLAVKLTNQNPWDIQDETKFISDLANFTALENSNNMVGVLADIKKLTAETNKLLSESRIGMNCAQFPKEPETETKTETKT